MQYYMSNNLTTLDDVLITGNITIQGSTGYPVMAIDNGVLKIASQGGSLSAGTRGQSIVNGNNAIANFKWGKPENILLSVKQGNNSADINNNTEIFAGATATGGINEAGETLLSLYANGRIYFNRKGLFRWTGQITTNSHNWQGTLVIEKLGSTPLTVVSKETTYIPGVNTPQVIDFNFIFQCDAGGFYAVKFIPHSNGGTAAMEGLNPVYNTYSTFLDIQRM